MDAMIKCKCGFGDDWEKFAAGQGRWECPKCGNRWRSTMCGAEAHVRLQEYSVVVEEQAPCPVCGRMYASKVTYPHGQGRVFERKTCGSLDCVRAHRMGTMARKRRFYTSAPIADELNWMRDANLCPL